MKSIALEPEPRRRHGAELPPHRRRHPQGSASQVLGGKAGGASAEPPEGLGLAGQVLAGY